MAEKEQKPFGGRTTLEQRVLVPINLRAWRLDPKSHPNEELRPGQDLHLEGWEFKAKAYTAEENQLLRDYLHQWLPKMPNLDHVFFFEDDPLPTEDPGVFMSTRSIGRNKGPIVTIHLLRREGNKVLKGDLGNKEFNIQESFAHESVHVEQEDPGYSEYHRAMVRYGVLASILDNALNREKPELERLTGHDLNFYDHVFGHPELSSWFFGNRTELTPAERHKTFVRKLQERFQLESKNIDSYLAGTITQKEFDEALDKELNSKVNAFKRIGAHPKKSNPLQHVKKDSKDRKKYHGLNSWLAFSHYYYADHWFDNGPVKLKTGHEDAKLVEAKLDALSRMQENCFHTLRETEDFAETPAYLNQEEYSHKGHPDGLIGRSGAVIFEKARNLRTQLERKGKDPLIVTDGIRESKTPWGHMQHIAKLRKMHL